MRRRSGPRRVRRPRRPKGPPKKRPPRQLNPRLQRELKRANHLMRNGEHANAAKVFISLGERAQDRGILKPAARLFLQAAMALIMANQVPDALPEAKKGLQLLAANGQLDELRFEAGRIIGALEDAGAETESQAIEALIQKQSGGKEASHNKGKSVSKRSLPSKCPFCGASLSLEQLQSGREDASECKYCGSVVISREIS